MNQAGKWAVVLLALSLGLNAGLLIGRVQGPKPVDDRRGPPGGPPRGGPHDRAGGFERMMERHLERLSRGLGLSDDQQQRLQVVYDEVFPHILERHRTLRATREEIGKRYSAAEIDARGLSARLRDLSRSQAELDSLVAVIMLREAEILTAEQRRRYAVRMPWAQRGGGPGGPPSPGGRRGPRGPGGFGGPPPGGPPDGP